MGQEFRPIWRFSEPRQLHEGQVVGPAGAAEPGSFRWAR